MFVSMNSELSSRSEGRSLRKLERIEYKMMNKCEAQAQVEDEIGELETIKSTDSKIREHLDNPSGTPVIPPSSGISEPVSEVFSTLDHDRE